MGHAHHTLLAAGVAASLVACWLLRRRKQSHTHDHATALAAGARSQLRAQRRALQEQQRAAKAGRRSSGRQPKTAQRVPQTTAAAAAAVAARPPPTAQSCPDSFGASRALTAGETRERLLCVLQATTRSTLAYNGARFPAGYHTWSLPGGPDGEPTVVRGERDASLRLDALRGAYDTRGKCVLDLGANQGGMLVGLADEIAEGVGVDFDTDCVNCATRMARQEGAGNLSFYVFDLDAAAAEPAGGTGGTGGTGGGDGGGGGDEHAGDGDCGGSGEVGGGELGSQAGGGASGRRVGRSRARAESTRPIDSLSTQLVRRAAAPGIGTLASAPSHEYEGLGRLCSFLQQERPDIILLLAVCQWVRSWREVRVDTHTHTHTERERERERRTRTHTHTCTCACACACACACVHLLSLGAHV